VWEIALNVNTEGWFTLSNWTPTGPYLWAAWAVEAGIIVEMVRRLAVGSIAREVFCERCDRWCTPAEMPALSAESFAAPMSEEQRFQFERVQAGDLDALASLPSAPNYLFPKLGVQTRRCDGCGQVKTYQVTLTQQVVDDDGETQQQCVLLTEPLIVSPAETPSLEGLKELRAA